MAKRVKQIGIAGARLHHLQAGRGQMTARGASGRWWRGAGIAALASATVLSPLAGTAKTLYALDASQTKVISLSDMLEMDLKRSCSTGKLMGRVVAREFSANDALLLWNFTIEMADGSRQRVYVHHSDSSLGTSNAERSMIYRGLQTIFNIGSKVSIEVFVCGSGGIATLDSVKLLQSPVSP